MSEQIETVQIIEGAEMPPAPAVLNFAPAPHAVASIEIESRRAQMEVVAAVMAARACPRDKRQARLELIEACRDAAFAKIAFYAVKRGKDVVEGASIHLAKAALGIWGNLQYVVTDHGETIATNADGKNIKASQVDIQVWDVQSNSRYCKRFQVKHWQNTQDGGYELKEETRVNDCKNRVISKEGRNGILHFIPRSLILELKQVCDATLAEAADIQALPEAVAWFTAKGITEAQLEQLLEKPLADAIAADVVRLRQVASSITDNVETLESFFGLPEKQDDAAPGSPAKRTRKPLQSEPEPTGEQFVAEPTESTQKPAW